MCVRTFSCFLLAGLVVFLTMAAAHAQPVFSEESKARAREESAQQQQRLRQEREAQNRFRRQNTPRPVLLDSYTDAPDSLTLPREASCFLVNRLALDITPPTVPAPRDTTEVLRTRFRFIQDILDQYAGLCLGEQGIQIILRRITHAVLQEGYSTTRFTLPAQDLSRHALTIQLIPGVIRHITTVPANAPVHWHNAFPMRAGDILNLRNLEQGIEQMKRAPSQDVAVQIHPGSHAGESDIVLQMHTSRKWRVFTSIDNNGDDDTGKHLLTTGLRYDNLLNLNDLLDVTLRTNADLRSRKHYMASGSLHYAIPYGHWTFSFFGSSSEYMYTWTDPATQDYEMTSQILETEVAAKRQLYRDKTQKSAAILRIHRQWYYGYSKYNGQREALSDDDRRTTHVDLGFTHTRYTNAGQLDLTLTNRWAFGGYASGVEHNPANNGATSRYMAHILEVSFSSPMTLMEQSLDFNATLYIQWTNKRLFSSDQIGIGSWYTVRGFDNDNMLSGDKGFYWRNELSGHFEGQQPYIGLDYGRVAGPSTQALAGKQLIGSALGIRGEWQGTSYDISAGFPLQHPANMRARPTLYFQVSYSH